MKRALLLEEAKTCPRNWLGRRVSWVLLLEWARRSRPLSPPRSPR